MLAGGVGAARFLRGLFSLVDPRDATIIVNTADDDTFFGLHVSPDLDTVTYTLAGRAPLRRGWGIRGDTFFCLRALARFYGSPWFRLGDRDLATNLFRTERLRAGLTLAEVTHRIARAFGVRATVLPMTNDRVRTFVTTEGRGPLPFQEYLVRHRARGKVRKIEFRGSRSARPLPEVLRAIGEADAVLLPPSNPLVSIGPILSLRGVRRALRECRARVLGISPLVRGRALKGPAHRMLAGLGHEVSPVGVARLYADFLDVFFLDEEDEAEAPRVAELGIRPVVAPIRIASPRRARELARRVLEELSR
ncbi:MAG: LPPG--FO 2-phospho-L-lactate transferase [Candidatus Binatia bacterium]|nr:MAG: LPPG--FO 2-phospho-L-lactate transferase [Candidatus Binatia bacterium]